MENSNEESSITIKVNEIVEDNNKKEDVVEGEIYFNGNGHQDSSPESTHEVQLSQQQHQQQQQQQQQQHQQHDENNMKEVPEEQQSMLIVMTAVNPNDLTSQDISNTTTTTTMSIMLPADEFLISSAQINEERRRKELGLLEGGGGTQSEQAGAEGFLTASAAAHMAELQQGDGGGPTTHAQSGGRSDAANEESWRAAYYEHPLTVATSAMLNISGVPPEEQQSSNMGFIYEYYKPLQQLPQDKDTLSGLTKPGAPGAASAAAAAAVAAAAALGDLWPNPTTNPTLMTSHHHKSATTNGISVGGVSGLLVAPPTSQSSTLSATNNHSVGSGGGSDYSPSATPAPPSASPRHPEEAGSPRPRSSSPELHGLFASPANTQAAAHLQQLQLLQHYTIKREPEDLSQPLTRKHLLLQDRDKLISTQQLQRGTTESVLVLGRKPINSNTVVVVKDEFERARDSPEDGGLLLKSPLAMTSSAQSSASPTAVYASQIFANLSAHTPATSVGGGGSPAHHFATEHIQYTTNPSQQGYVGSSSPGSRTSSGGPSYTITSANDPYYRDYFAATESPYQLQRQTSAIQYTDSGDSGATSGAVATSAFVERYVRQSAAYKTAAGSVALTVDLPSPDSGIGTDAITPRDQTTIQQNFDYTELCQAPLLSDPLTQQRSSSAGSVVSASGTGAGGSVTSGGRSRPWHDFGRQNDADKVQIPKVYSQYGFKYYLETPISTSQRREDDRITYINKGQFYGITLEYAPDPETTLKCQTVKSVVMLMFREEKSPEDEIKAWQFWHGRQHSVKQRILDADTKNSVGLVGCIEEVAHNAIAVYWNPLESSAKINVAVQCLSTDFSSQKGVKGLPLHLQIDTYEDPRDGPVVHRGYSQIKVFCDKGAERKTRDEERRAAKRKMTATGRKKLDELYHPPAERSEFYAMSDMAKPPVLFTPAEDIDKLTSMELQGFYGHETDSSSLSNGEVGGPGGGVRGHGGSIGTSSSVQAGAGGYLMHGKHHHPHHPTPTTLKFHNHFPPEHPGDKKDVLGDPSGDSSVFSSPSQPPLKRPKLQQVPSPSSLHHPGPHHSPGLGACPPPLNERVMLYVRQDSEDIYTPLHVVPPSTAGLIHAIESKYKISTSAISNLYRKNRRGITARLDDDMLRYYCNEDLFIIEFKQIKQDEEIFDVTLCEVDD